MLSSFYFPYNEGKTMKERPTMQRRLYRFGLPLSLSLLLAACGTAEQTDTPKTEHTNHEDHADHASHGADDQLEKTAGPDTLPAFLDEQDQSIQTIYRSVAKHSDLLKKMPCYCGCGESAGHTSNYDCFIEEQNATSTTWTTHGITCGTCLDIAAQSIVAYQKGSSVKEIRTAIDQTYAKTGVTPTPTPAL
jgi:hypothetical protein